MVRRGILAVVVGLGLCAGAAIAHADQVVLSPVEMDQYSESAGGTNLSVAHLYMQISRIPHSAPDPNAAYVSKGFMKYALSSLPSDAVVTGASLLFHANSNTGAVPVTLSMASDGGTSQDVGTQSIVGANDFTISFSSLDFLQNRSSALASGYVTLSLAPAAGPPLLSGPAYVEIGEGPHPFNPPQLTITYTLAPEPASVGVLGAGALLLLRRRR